MNKAQPLVDPFITFQKSTRHPKLPQPQYGRHWIVNVRYGQQQQHTNSPDMLRQPTHTRPPWLNRHSINDAPTQIAIHHSHKQHSSTAPTPVIYSATSKKQRSAKSRYKSTLRKLQLPLIILGAFILGPIVQSLVIGELIIALYGAYAIFRQVPSRTTFLLSIIILIGITSLYAIGNTSSLTVNFAVYCFLLFVIGTVSLGIELRAANA